MLSTFFERPTRVATTGSDGRFALLHVIPGTFLGATARGHHPSSLRRIANRGTPQENPPPVELILELGDRPSLLQGTVVGTAGAPVAGAQMDLLPAGGQQVAEPVDIGIVQRRVDLVEDANRRRPRQKHGEQQGQRRHRLLPAGQQ